MITEKAVLLLRKIKWLYREDIYPSVDHVRGATKFISLIDLLIEAFDWKLRRSLKGKGGAWTWFQDPRVITDGDNTYIAWVDRGGDVNVGQFSHEEQEWFFNYGIDNIGETDDHGSPSMYIRNDGKLLVMYQIHNADYFYYRISSQRADISNFESIRKFKIEGGGGNYPQFIEKEGVIYLFHRAAGDNSSREWYYRKSNDKGKTWSEQRKFLEFTDYYSMYVKISFDGENRVDFIASPHPRENDSNVYHGYFIPESEEFYDSNGNRLNPPFGSEELDIIWDCSKTGRKGWVWDIRTNDGRPEALFATIDKHNAENHRYQYSKFLGGEWMVEDIVETHQLVAQSKSALEKERNSLPAEPHYSPGIYFDHQQDSSQIYLSRNTKFRSYPETDTSKGIELEKWERNNGSFERVEKVTSDSDSNQFRPVTPINMYNEGKSPIKACWMFNQRNKIYSFDEFTTEIRCYVKDQEGNLFFERISGKSDY